MALNDGNIVKRTSQYIDNQSFDETTGLPMVELAGPNEAGTNVNRVLVNDDGSINVATSGVTATANNILMREKSTDSDIIYIGEATNGTATSAASWKITRLDLNTLLDVTYADGNLNYDNVWDNRESLTYS